MYKVAFIGAGYMTEEHIKAFIDIPEVQIVGIYSKTISRAELLLSKYSLNGSCYNSITDLYKNTQADLVVISVPELSTKNVCFEAFNFPWLCLVEKPVGYNFSDALFIANLAETKNSKVYVALNRRMYSSTIEVLHQLENSNEQRLIHVYDQEDPISAKLTGQPDIIIENWMFANSIHIIDYFTILGRGHITEIVPIINWNNGSSPFHMTKIYFESGDIGIYEALWNAPGPWAVTISTKSKRWEIKPLEEASVQSYGSRKSEKILINDWDFKFKPGIRYQAEQAVRAISCNDHKLVSIQEALRTMELINKIYFNN